MVGRGLARNCDAESQAGKVDDRRHQAEERPDLEERDQCSNQILKRAISRIGVVQSRDSMHIPIPYLEKKNVPDHNFPHDITSRKGII